MMKFSERKLVIKGVSVFQAIEGLGFGMEPQSPFLFGLKIERVVMDRITKLKNKYPGWNIQYVIFGLLSGINDPEKIEDTESNTAYMFWVGRMRKEFSIAMKIGFVFSDRQVSLYYDFLADKVYDLCEKAMLPK